MNSGEITHASNPPSLPVAEPSALPALLVSAATLPLAATSRRVYAPRMAAFLAYLRDSGSPYSRASVQRHLARLTATPTVYNQSLAAIKRLSAEMAAQGLLSEITRGTIQSLPAQCAATVSSARAKVWIARDDLRALLALPDRTTRRGRRDAALLALLCCCGLRRAEAASLRATQLAVQPEQPERERGRERDARLICSVFGKGSKIRRLLVPRAAEADLKARLADLDTAQHPCDDVPLLALSESGVRKVIRHYATLLGVPTLAPHSLRRTFAALARSGGAPLEEIQSALGHASIRTTQIYLATLDSSRAGDYLGL